MSEIIYLIESNVIFPILGDTFPKTPRITWMLDHYARNTEEIEAIIINYYGTFGALCSDFEYNVKKTKVTFEMLKDHWEIKPINVTLELLPINSVDWLEKSNF